MTSRAQHRRAIAGTLLVVVALALGAATPSNVQSSAANLAKVTVSVTGNGLVKSVGTTAVACKKTCDVAVPVGTALALEASPAAEFSEWTGSCTGRAPRCDLAVEGKSFVRARFGGTVATAPPSKLLVTVAGKGYVQGDVSGLISCPSKCSTRLSSGALNLSAVASADSQFVGWSGGACAGIGTCRIVFGTGTPLYEVAATFRRASIPAGPGQVLVTNPTPPLQGPIGSNQAQGTVRVGSQECTSKSCTYSFSNGSLVALRGKPRGADAGFAYWQGSCRGTASICLVAIDGSTPVTSYFYGSSPLDTAYGLEVSRSGDGHVESSPSGISCGSGTGCQAAFEEKQKVKLTAVPGASSRFAGWSLECSATKTPVCTVTVDGQRHVSAIFLLIRDKLTLARTGTGTGTVTSGPSGISCGTTCTATFVRKQSVTLQASAGLNSRFVTWAGACSGTTCSVTMNGNASVTARFDLIQDQVQVRKQGDGDGTVTSAPGGVSCGASCSAAFNRGSTVVLRAVPDASSRFVGWSGGCSGIGDCSLPMKGPRNATARFVRKRDELKIQKLGMGTGEVSSAPAGISCGSVCSRVFPRTTQVALTATPAAGSTFAGWTGACSGTASSCNVTVNGPAVVSARFSRICLARSTTGFAVAVKQGPRRVVVSARLAGPVTARLRLFHGQKQLTQKIVSGLVAGQRQLRLDVPKSVAKGNARVGVQIADACGGQKIFSKKISLPAP